MNCLLCYLFSIFITSNDLQKNSNSLKNKRTKYSLMTRLKPLELGSYFKHNINQSKTLIMSWLDLILVLRYHNQLLRKSYTYWRLCLNISICQII